MSNRQIARPPLAGGRGVVRLMVLVLVGAGIAAALHWRAALDPLAIAAMISRDPAAPLVFLGLHVAASLLFVPRTVLAVAAGLVFGMSWGVAWAAAGSVLGAVAGFLIARYLKSGVVDLEGYSGIGPILDRIRRGGWRSVAVLRLVPIIPHSLANYALGLTQIRLLPFAFGSLVGQLPMTIACVDLGAAGERLALGDDGWVMPTVIGGAALALSLVVPVAARRRAG
jgi:uncharacterized membrane protein YdjX (TVP38/TMEM64 family)